MRNGLLFLVLVTAGCSTRTEPAPIGGEVAIPKSAPRKSTIPIEISYPIIKDVEEYSAFNKKRMVSVRLNQKVTPEVLSEIALEVKAGERHQYERTFIFYCLPEKYGVKNSPWATSHFDPTLEVDIMGLTKADEEKLLSLPLARYENRIGIWLIEDQYASHLAVLYKTSTGLKLDAITAGGKHTSDMVELPSEKGRRFKKAKGSDIYEVDASGVLRLYGYEGKLLVAADPLTGHQ